MTLFLNGYVQAKLCLICDTQQKDTTLLDNIIFILNLQTIDLHNI